jgi:hypothetical protein
MQNEAEALPHPAVVFMQLGVRAYLKLHPIVQQLAQLPYWLTNRVELLSSINLAELTSEIRHTLIRIRGTKKTFT